MLMIKQHKSVITVVIDKHLNYKRFVGRKCVNHIQTAAALNKAQVEYFRLFPAEFIASCNQTGPEAA
jgi:hypothetical protein